MSRRGGRKLLVASLGVGAVSYVACSNSVVANLMAPPQDASADVAADAPGDTGADGDASDATSDRFSPFDVVANLVAP
jgi:hypothetical protein